MKKLINFIKTKPKIAAVILVVIIALGIYGKITGDREEAEKQIVEQQKAQEATDKVAEQAALKKIETERAETNEAKKAETINQNTTMKEIPPEIAQINTKIENLYQKMLNFKDYSNFHENGFSIAGQNKWLETLDNLSNQIPKGKVDYFFSGVAASTLRQIAFDYMRSQGTQTAEIKEREQYFKDTLAGKIPE